MSEFFHGDLPQSFQFSFEQSLYNTSLHRTLQSNVNWNSFYLIEKNKQLVHAAIHFYIEGELAISPFRAPFGGIESNIAVDEVQVAHLFESAVVKLSEKGVKKLIVKQAPFLLENDSRKQVFRKAGFGVQLSETDSFIQVGRKYDEQLQARKSKKLRSLLKSDFLVQQLAMDELPAVYNFILQMRERKGYPVSMSLPQLTALANTFPERVILFSVSHAGKMIAASICAKVKSDWLYDFYHDHDPAYNSESPVLLLVRAIYDYCIAHDIRWLELGTSMHGTEINEGLLLFKERLGGKQVLKITFEKILRS